MDSERERVIDVELKEKRRNKRKVSQRQERD